MAPEIHMNQPYLGWAADVWSLGILVFIMLTGQVPFMSSDKKQFTSKVVRCEYSFP